MRIQAKRSPSGRNEDVRWLCCVHREEDGTLVRCLPESTRLLVGRDPEEPLMAAKDRPWWYGGHTLLVRGKSDRWWYYIGAYGGYRLHLGAGERVVRFVSSVGNNDVPNTLLITNRWYYLLNEMARVSRTKLRKISNDSEAVFYFYDWFYALHDREANRFRLPKSHYIRTCCCCCCSVPDDVVLWNRDAEEGKTNNGLA